MTTLILFTYSCIIADS